MGKQRLTSLSSCARVRFAPVSSTARSKRTFMHEQRSGVAGSGLLEVAQLWPRRRNVLKNHEAAVIVSILTAAKARTRREAVQRDAQ